ncbi:hypothetical protein DSUL_140070 [Desulfovibrionales bacterium]
MSWLLLMKSIALVKGQLVVVLLNRSVPSPKPLAIQYCN